MEFSIDILNRGLQFFFWKIPFWILVFKNLNVSHWALLDNSCIVSWDSHSFWKTSLGISSRFYYDRSSLKFSETFCSNPSKNLFVISLFLFKLILREGFNLLNLLANKTKLHFLLSNESYIALIITSEVKLVSPYHSSSAELWWWIGVEPGTLRFRVDFIAHYTTTRSTTCHQSAQCL